MEFVLTREVNGVEETLTVEAENPTHALTVGSFEDFISGRTSDNDIATTGVYEVGGEYNHLISISEDMEMRRWANSRIEELEQKIKELTGEDE